MNHREFCPFLAPGKRRPHSGEVDTVVAKITACRFFLSLSFYGNSWSTEEKSPKKRPKRRLRGKRGDSNTSLNYFSLMKKACKENKKTPEQIRQGICF